MADFDDPFFSKPRSCEEIADYLGATRTFVWREIERGRLRAIKLSNKFLRVMPGDLRSWLEAGATRPKESATQKEIVGV